MTSLLTSDLMTTGMVQDHQHALAAEAEARRLAVVRRHSADRRTGSVGALGRASSWCGYRMIGLGSRLVGAKGRMAGVGA